MNRIGIVVLSGLLGLSSSSYGQSATPSGTPVAVGRGAFPVKITKTLDSGKLKEGGTLEVETAGSFKLPDGTLVPKGSKLMGHIVASKARSHGDSESELTLMFDRLNIVNGRQLSVKGTVQAVFPPPDEVDPGVPAASTSPGANSPNGGAVGITPDYKPMTEIKTGADTTTGGRPGSVAEPNSVGVHGIDNLQLQNGILTSKGKQVKLGSGDRMIVHVDIFQ
jgi:hypothetical protein